jgi:mono/diheme cytochrome c family protein
MDCRWLTALASFAAGWLLAVAPGASRAGDPRAGAAEFFEKSVRPVLANHCFECHGSRKHKGGLRLDSREAMLMGGESGPAIVPGSPEKSLLVKAIHYQDELKMPPKGRLSQMQMAALAKWIKQGAPWPQARIEVRQAAKAEPFKISAKDRAFWSFQPLADPAVPGVHDPAWTRTPIDNFVLARLEAKHITPVAFADRPTLIRRATFDLIGLPPRPDEVEAFVNDPAPDAFARVIDRLLSSPHYGERWARHWMDVARYAEDQAHTFEARLYPQGFRYRDWLVRAFNSDMPYDRFIMEQLAADLLHKPPTPSDTKKADEKHKAPTPEARDYLENLPALGFFALGPVYYGDPKRLDQIDDRIDTLTRGLLGLTVACARCHDHKYDPIATRDYYSLAGVAAGTDYVEISLQPGQEGRPVVPAKGKDKKKAARGALIHAIRDLPQPVTMRVHIRGNPKTLGEEAPRRFLPILAGDNAPAFMRGSGRLELARAIASKDNPLTARVIVNRIWQHHFGQGLVRTASNFGALGEPPTHPELLDYLARRFIAQNWSIKTLHRDIMLSAVYQLSSHVQPGAPQLEIDAGNRLLWRMNRRRLEVEAWRDAMLAVSGKLDPKLGGPSGKLEDAKDCRRTLYGKVSRHELNPLLRLFDFPDPNLTSAGRSETTVPLQQLFVLNSEFMVGNARALASRLAGAAGDDTQRIRQAFLLLYGRPVTPREMQLGLSFLARSPVPGQRLSRWEQYAQVLLAANEFLYLD